MADTSNTCGKGDCAAGCKFPSECPLIHERPVGETTGKQLRLDTDANTEAIEAINAHSEASLRNRALTFSMITFSWYMPAQIGYFIWRAEWLPVPDVLNYLLWSVMMAPWLGFGMGNVTKILVDKFGGAKK